MPGVVVDEALIAQRVLVDLQRQVDGMLEYRLREAMAPILARATDALMRDLRMDFGAADFKTDPDTGELVFLELNTSPMFARFNQVSEGRLAADMVRQLLS